jgi:hypothetical protein
MAIADSRYWLVGCCKNLLRGDVDGNTSDESVDGESGGALIAPTSCTHAAAQIAGTLECTVVRRYEEGPTSRINGLLSSSRLTEPPVMKNTAIALTVTSSVPQRRNIHPVSLPWRWMRTMMLTVEHAKAAIVALEELYCG